LFISESKKNLNQKGIPGIVISDFLKVYEEKVGKYLLHSIVGNQYKVDNEGISKFLSLVSGFPIETNTEELIIKPRMYMSILDDKFFKSYEKPKGIFAAHFLQFKEQATLYQLDNDKIKAISKTKHELSFSSNIFIDGMYESENKNFLFEKGDGGIIITMNTQCSCNVGGAACHTATCRPWGGWGGTCGYVETTIDNTRGM
jgi:hypothetical protein